MSNLKKDIEGVLKEFEQEYSDAYTEPDDGIDFDRADKALKTATTQIINLIESVMPEPITLRGIQLIPPADNKKYKLYTDGYNQAIKDIKSKLIGEE